MDWGSPEFVIAIIALSYGGWILNSWIRAKHGYELENEWCGRTTKSGPDADRKIELLTNENTELVGKIDRLHERLEVLERIATDPARRTSEEIEKLR